MPLPNLVDHNLYIDEPSFVDGICSIFNIDFFQNRPTFRTRNVYLKSHPTGELFGKNYDWTFHHIITKEDPTGLPRRILCLPRAQRIRFPRHFIDQETTLLCWTSRKGNEEKFYISDPSFHYLVVLAKRVTTQNYILISAFPTDGGYYRKKLKKEYERITGTILTP